MLDYETFQFGQNRFQIGICEKLTLTIYSFRNRVILSRFINFEFKYKEKHKKNMKIEKRSDGHHF